MTDVQERPVLLVGSVPLEVIECRVRSGWYKAR